MKKHFAKQIFAAALAISFVSVNFAVTSLGKEIPISFCIAINKRIFLFIADVVPSQEALLSALKASFPVI